MQKLSNIPSDIRILAIGESGSGKTRLIGTLCQLMPTLVITGDREGLDTLRWMQINPDVELISDWSTAHIVIDRIKRVANKYSAIAIDDFGSLQQAARDYIEHRPRGFIEERRANSNHGEFLAGVEKELILGERRFDQALWGNMWTIMDTLLWDLLKLPSPVKLITTLEAAYDNIRTSTINDRLAPKLQGDIREAILASCSLVMELTKEYNKDGKVTFVASCQPHPKVATKDRYTLTGQTWQNPTMSQILAYIGEAKAAWQSPVKA